MSLMFQDQVFLKDYFLILKENFNLEFLFFNFLGGMSNELNNIVNIHTNGVFEGVAIGGDRYPGTTFMDHLLRYHVS